MSSTTFAIETASKVQVFQTLYAGEDEETFSEENPGVGVEVSVSTMKTNFNWVAKGRLTTISGSQDFDDGGTSRNLDLKFYQASFEAGFIYFPMERKKAGINIYVGANALMSFNYLSFTETSSLTNLDPSYQSLGFGYTTNIGIEWYPMNSHKWAITTEFSQRNETANLADVSGFSLNAFSLSFGFGW